MIRAVPALLSVFPRLNFAARVQILIDDIPARIFLGVVVTGCQQKTERQDEDASESEHRGTFGREIIYVRLALVQGVLSARARAREFGRGHLNLRVELPWANQGLPQPLGVASILRTGLREIFVPKGLQDSAWVLTPGIRFKTDPP